MKKNPHAVALGRRGGKAAWSRGVTDTDRARLARAGRSGAAVRWHRDWLDVLHQAAAWEATYQVWLMWSVDNVQDAPGALVDHVATRRMWASVPLSTRVRQARKWMGH